MEVVAPARQYASLRREDIAARGEALGDVAEADARERRGEPSRFLHLHQWGAAHQVGIPCSKRVRTRRTRSASPRAINSRGLPSNCGWGVSSQRRTSAGGKRDSSLL